MELCSACSVDPIHSEEFDLSGTVKHGRRKAETHLDVRVVYRIPRWLVHWVMRHVAYDQIKRCVAPSAAGTGRWQYVLPGCVA